MRVIHTNNDTFAVADGNLEHWYSNILEKQPLEVFIATGIQWTRLHLGHILGEIEVEQLSYSGTTYFQDLDGWFGSGLPRDFNGEQSDLIFKIVKERRKQKDESI